MAPQKEVDSLSKSGRPDRWRRVGRESLLVVMGTPFACLPNFPRTPYSILLIKLRKCGIDDWMVRRVENCLIEFRVL